MRNWLTNNWMIKLASLFVAILLWLHVQEQSSYVERETYNVALVATNLSSDLVVTAMPQTVKVTAEAPSGALEGLDPARITAVVDLRDAKTGKNQIVPELRQPMNIRAKWEIREPIVTVEVERTMSATHSVEIAASGAPPNDLIYLGSTVQPLTVEVRGPNTMVKAVKAVRAVLNLARVRPATSYALKVEVLGANGKPLGQVVAEPAEVMVKPAVAPALTPKQLSVTPRWVGVPAFGYRLVALEASPSQIAVTGKSEVLGRLVAVETEPITIDGINEDRVVQARLKLPAGVQTDANPLVRVTIRVERIPEATDGDNP